MEVVMWRLTLKSGAVSSTKWGLLGRKSTCWKTHTFMHASCYQGRIDGGGERERVLTCSALFHRTLVMPLDGYEKYHLELLWNSTFLYV